MFTRTNGDVSDLGEHKAKDVHAQMDDGRKRVLGIMAAILTAMHMRTASDLFGMPAAHRRQTS